MDVEIEEHRHCSVCGSVVRGKGRARSGVVLCGPRCAKMYEDEMAKARRLKVMWFFPIIFFLIIFIILVLRG
ncbi:DUF2116 family Zn-ribbon domain-containing protein [Candidatus Hecatella orcuttiae]|jgi:predicted nucleic acid-binding Zn ribbon protein|uniref:DUF2116 family Zn-ribbon domain-containing protein n=1 Tax=Candidatus Hecatella orcuttiae TaxID=1935119 RepID=UPI0028682FD2|nr:DUF2116 family Zn-ribbon domain-containing protein [Candidatus Hecatella orcuttiae]